MNYHMIRTDDMLNGSGLRVVVFLSGCAHHCNGCHNPETWGVDSGKKFNTQALQGIINELEKDYISGITISGGDPLHENNINDVYDMLLLIKEHFPDKTIWLYTGYKWDEIMSATSNALTERRKKIIEMCDVVCDGRFIKSLADENYPWVGSTNQNVVDVKKTLEKGEIVLYNN